ncbi:glycosyltransferase family 15 protein [Mycena rosella]|uniref:Glycosyltransferase family 15 protein n=1 Tax=Mycena rosella TaxID=1033263 RepID=A0AAD7C638_MYCRO|nr:glycosyltransferase family 15 protein [Mycena rosella]
MSFFFNRFSHWTVVGTLLRAHNILFFSNTNLSRQSAAHLRTESIAPIDEDPSDAIPRPRIWYEPPYKTPIPEKYYSTSNSTRRASAAIVILARNLNLPGVVSSMTQLEAKLNHKFGYPYVFLNEEPFTEEFKRTITALTEAPVQFGLVPSEHWYQPSWVDEKRASAARDRMRLVPYGSERESIPPPTIYSSPPVLLRQELLKPFKYYWRYTRRQDVDFDPFLFMEGEDKKYGPSLAISLPEYKKTIRTLWPHVKAFMKAHPDLIEPDNAMGMLLDRNGVYYNRCHFWSNFEIASLDLWRSDGYMKFFEYLDLKGGFYYERWGDAPVHTLGAALFARKDQIHFFNEIGYAHMPYEHCPAGLAHARGKCECDPSKSFDHHGSSCLPQYDRLFSGPEEMSLDTGNNSGI